MSDNQPPPPVTNVKPRGLRPGGGPGPMGLAEKPKHFRTSLRQLTLALAPYRVTLVVAVIATIISTISLVIGPKILGGMTNQIVAAFTNQLPLNYQILGLTALILLGVHLLSAIADMIQGWLLAGATQKLTRQLRRDLSAKINRLPIAYFDTHPFGDTLSRLTNDVDTIGQTLNQSLSNILSSLTAVLGILGMMLTISWQMTLVTLITLPLSLGLVTLITSKSQKYFKRQQDQLGQLNGQVEEMYAGHLVVKLSAAEELVEKQFAQVNQRLYLSTWRAQFLSGMMMPLMQVVGNLGYVGVVVVGSWCAAQRLVNLGDIQAFIQYVHRFNQPLSQVAQVMTVLQTTLAASERVFEFMAEEEESPDPIAPTALPKVTGAVEFKNVFFGYEPSHAVIKGFSAKIKPGQKVALVGPTGAGKTTLVNLLLRFYDPRAGKILIDGINITTLTRQQVRAQFGLVLQDTWLFHGTVRENLKYGQLTVSEAQMRALAKAAAVEALRTLLLFWT